MSKIKVDKIVLKISKKKEIVLSFEEAKKLQEILTDLLGVKTYTVTTGSYVIESPYPVPYEPVPRRYERWYVEPTWTGGVITSGSDSSSRLISSVEGGNSRDRVIPMLHNKSIT